MRQIKIKRIRKDPIIQKINLLILLKTMQNLYQSDSIMDDSMSAIQNHSQQLNHEPNQSNFISNRQKILNLHERIKMLDQIGNANKEHKMNLQFFSKNPKKQVKFEDEPHSNQDENLRKIASEKTFLKKSLTIKPLQTQSNVQKPQVTGNYSRQKIQSPTHHQHNSSLNFNQQQHSSLQNNQSPINNSNITNHKQSQSASRMPYSQSPKHQGYESQNISNSYYRPIQTNDLYPLESKYLSIEDKFLQFKMSEQNLLANIDGEIRQLQESCKYLKKQYEKTEKRNEETVDSIEKSITAQIVDLSAQLKEVKRGAVEALDNKQKAIRCETIAMIAEDFESQCKIASTEIQTHLDAAQRSLQKQQNLRDETAEFLINSFGDEIIKLEQVLNAERQSRISKNDELLKLINSVEDQLMDKIHKEKRQMIQNIEAMENMLEQVCYKIEEKILGN